jgi:Zn-dependent alcohol dehydrogenase
VPAWAAAARSKAALTAANKKPHRLAQHNGLCHTDIHMVNNDWDITGYPFIPGHEVVGVVAAAGAAVPACARVGQRVGVGWIKNSCRCCRRRVPQPRAGPACMRMVMRFLRFSNRL